MCLCADIECALLESVSMIEAGSRSGVETSVVIMPTCESDEACESAEYFAENCSFVCVSMTLAHYI